MTNEAPDKNCYTLPNGDCIGVDCMHNRRDISSDPALPIGEEAWHAHDGLGLHPASERHISSDPVDDTYERERYDAKIENWRKTDPEAAAAFDERHSDISSDPVPAREHQAGVCGARGVTTGSYAPCCHLPAGHAGMHNSGGIVPQTWFEPLTPRQRESVF